MRDADRPDVERPLQRFKLDPRLDAQLGVDFRQRLVEQKQPRLAHVWPLSLHKQFEIIDGADRSRTLYSGQSRWSVALGHFRLSPKDRRYGGHADTHTSCQLRTRAREDYGRECQD
jgi:hypothetical protein